MKVLFDHQTFTFQPWGGVSRLFCELLREFANQQNVDADLSLRYSSNHYINNAGIADCRDIFPSCSAKWKTALVRAANQRESTKRIRQGAYDIFHPTYYDAYFLRFLNDKPFILSVYDMTPERTGQGLSVWERLATRKASLIKKATRIIAISENTKRDIVELCGTDPNKIDVVPLATSLTVDDTDSGPGRELDLPQDYVLYVGSRHSYKNFTGLVEAISPLLRSHPGLSLLCAGGGTFSPTENGLIKRLGIESKVVHVPFANDAALAQLYSGATVFVFPSKYEGFGIPVLEAFACNCPVATSNQASLPEVAGDAAILFDPSDKADMSQAIGSLLDNEMQRERLRQAGKTRLELFTWKKTAERTLRSYEKALEAH